MEVTLIIRSEAMFIIRYDKIRFCFVLKMYENNNNHLVADFMYILVLINIF